MTSWIPAGPAILFAPADRPERFAKAAERADMVILDLEDGARPENRDAARQAIIDVGESGELDPQRTIVRINPPETPDYELDLQSVKKSTFTQVMLPKAEAAADVAALGELGLQVIALIETPRGVLSAAEIAAADATVALFWGAEDLTAGLGGTASRFAEGEANAGTYRDVPRFARAQVQLAAAAYGKAALDSVHVDIADDTGLRAEALDAAALGYAATCCIHPKQVGTIREAYQPTEAQIDWATRLLAEAEKNAGAFSFEGQMVDAPLFRQAEVIARRAGR